MIARALDLRESTVKAHVKQIMRRLGITNRTQAALLASHGMSPANPRQGVAHLARTNPLPPCSPIRFHG